MICAGAFYPCCLQLIVAPFQTKAGTINALAGAIDMFVTSLIAVVVIKYWLIDMQSLGILFLTVSGMLAISWWLMDRQISSRNCEQSTNINKTNSSMINKSIVVKT